MQIEKEYWHISRLTHFCWCLSVFREMSQSYSSRVWRLSEVPLLFLRLTETHNDLTWERRNPSSSIQYQCQDLNDSNSISRCLKPSSTCKRHEFRRQTREKRSTLGHFFPLSNVYVNSLALGRNEVRAPKECVSGNKHQQIPSSSDSLLCSCKLAYAHKRTFSLRPPLPLQGPNWRLGKKMAALWPTVFPQHPAQGGDGTRFVPSLPLQPYPPPMACVPVHQHQSLLRTRKGQSQTQANALQGMFQL